MKDPFQVEEFDKAYMPMYQEPMILTLSSGERQTVFVCILDDTNDELITEEAIDTNRRSIVIYFKKSDLVYMKQIQVGDTVTVKGKKYNIITSDNDGIGEYLKAREA